jgi:2-phosphoglycerate kinase
MNNLIIIYGVPGVGKTTVAQELSNKIPNSLYLEGDSLKSIIQKKVKKLEHPFVFTSSTEAWGLLGDRDDENVISGMKKYREELEKFMRDEILNFFKENETIVFEGAMISPNFKIDNVNVNHFLITQTEIDIHKKQFMKHRMDRRLIRVNPRIKENFSNSLLIQDYLIKEAKRKKVNIVNNDDLEETVDSIINLIN